MCNARRPGEPARRLCEPRKLPEVYNCPGAVCDLPALFAQPARSLAAVCRSLTRLHTPQSAAAHRLPAAALPVQPVARRAASCRRSSAAPTRASYNGNGGSTQKDFWGYDIPAAHEEDAPQFNGWARDVHAATGSYAEGEEEDYEPIEDDDDRCGVLALSRLPRMPARTLPALPWPAPAAHVPLLAPSASRPHNPAPMPTAATLARDRRTGSNSGTPPPPPPAAARPSGMKL